MPRAVEQARGTWLCSPGSRVAAGKGMVVLTRFPARDALGPRLVLRRPLLEWPGHQTVGSGAQPGCVKECPLNLPRARGGQPGFSQRERAFLDSGPVLQDCLSSCTGRGLEGFCFRLSRQAGCRSSAVRVLRCCQVAVEADPSSQVGVPFRRKVTCNDRSAPQFHGWRCLSCKP